MDDEVKPYIYVRCPQCNKVIDLSEIFEMDVDMADIVNVSVPCVKCMIVFDVKMPEEESME